MVKEEQKKKSGVERRWGRKGAGWRGGKDKIGQANTGEDRRGVPSSF